MAISEKWEIEKLEEDKNKTVAIVGGGPSGITASAFLARRGFKVSIYEKHKEIRRAFISWDTRL
ncbi:MAG: NAD(P)-binding protein [Clostridia bacterium]|nr:NAD(P)-binding protein [Clostridia bacterium]